jgi:hypothetical protein
VDREHQHEADRGSRLIERVGILCPVAELVDLIERVVVTAWALWIEATSVRLIEVRC